MQERQLAVTNKHLIAALTRTGSADIRKIFEEKLFAIIDYYGVVA